MSLSKLLFRGLCRVLFREWTRHLVLMPPLWGKALFMPVSFKPAPLKMVLLRYRRRCTLLILPLRLKSIVAVVKGLRQCLLALVLLRVSPWKFQDSGMMPFI